MPDKVYLGDAVYVELENNMLKLTVENGDYASEIIYLEAEVLDNFITYLKRKGILK